jgi:hypothetical protein
MKKDKQVLRGSDDYGTDLLYDTPNGYEHESLYSPTKLPPSLEDVWKLSAKK